MTTGDTATGIPSLLGVAESFDEDPDTPELGKALAWTMARSAAHPVDLATATLAFAGSLAKLGPATLARIFGISDSALLSDPGDRRFADVTWQQNPAFFALRARLKASAAICCSEALPCPAGARSAAARESRSWK